MEDNLESIFDAIKKAALIHQTGANLNIDISSVRPKGDMVISTQGTASGPIAFMNILETALESMKQATKRKGEVKVTMNISHPDVLEFIMSKDSERKFQNCNLSIKINDTFLKAVEEDTNYDLIHPISKAVVNTLNAKNVFELIMTQIWKHSEPTIVIDSSQSQNQASISGFINIKNFRSSAIKDLDWNKLKETIQTSLQFLNNSINASSFIDSNIEKISKEQHPMSLGIIGFADLLSSLDLSYDSEESVQLAEKIMNFIETEAKESGSNLQKNVHISFSSTKILSKIAEVSRGTEPLMQIEPEWQIRMKSIFQKHTPSEEVISFPYSATLEEFKTLMLKAFKHNCQSLKFERTNNGSSVEIFVSKPKVSKIREQQEIIDNQAIMPFNDLYQEQNKKRIRIAEPVAMKAEEIILPPIEALK